MIIAGILVACVQRLNLPKGVHYDENSGVFEWWDGSVTLPVGYSYQPEPGDTFNGNFASWDRTLIIYHDMGS